MQTRNSNESETNQSSNNELPAGCLRFFGLPFFVMGTGFLIYGLSLFYLWHQSGSWPKVSGTVLVAEIKTGHTSKGGRTYSVAGRYKYTYQEKTYENDRITIESGSSSNRNEHQEMLDILEAAQRDQTGVDVFVNPQNPQDSFIFRKISMGMVMMTGLGGVFSMVGLLFILGFLPGAIPGVDQRKLQQNPEQPWLADPRWNEFVIKTRNWKNLLQLWGIAIFMTVFVSLFVSVMIMDSSTPIFAWAIISIFVLATLALDWHAVYSTLQYLKFSESTLLLGQFPINTGGEFVAVIAVTPRFSPGQEFKFELRCERKLITGSGKNSTTTKDSLYQSSQTITIKAEHFCNHKIYVPIKLKIQEKSKTTTPEASNPSITWWLKATASVPGIDFLAEFPLPVYEVADTNLIKYKN